MNFVNLTISYNKLVEFDFAIIKIEKEPDFLCVSMNSVFCPYDAQIAMLEHRLQNCTTFRQGLRWCGRRIQEHGLLKR